MKKENDLNRRDFIKKTTTAAIVLGFPTIIPASAFGANDKVQVAVLGVNGRGKDHIKGFQSQSHAEVACLCDPDKVVLQTRADEFEKQYLPDYETILFVSKNYYSHSNIYFKFKKQ